MHKQGPDTSVRDQWTDGFGMYGCPGNEIRFYVNKWDKQFVSTRYRLAARALARRQIRKRC